MLVNGNENLVLAILLPTEVGPGPGSVKDLFSSNSPRGLSPDSLLEPKAGLRVLAELFMTLVCP